MTRNIYAVGLTRLEIHTLKILLPISFQIIICDPQKMSGEDVENVMRDACCIVANPKKMVPGQLQAFLEEQEDLQKIGHVPLLLLTENPTREQRQDEIWNSDMIQSVDLRSRLNRPIKDAVKLLRKQSFPTWLGMKDMRCNGLNDSWCLLDIETSDLNPLVSDIIAIRIARIANYEITYQHTYYIKQRSPIDDTIAELTGISNNKLEHGVSLEEALEEIENTVKDPFVIVDEDFVIPFLRAAYHKCAMRYRHPYLCLDGLISIIYGYKMIQTHREAYEYLSEKSVSTEEQEQWFYKLQLLTNAVFSELRKRYDVSCAGDLKKIYAYEISDED